ncbi:hypothetical protein PFLUV_G00022940 [Perca fluviatilis]|uniref:Delta-like protein n=1 Tax=Perca fluviatilis TaxID=8168 RepID=A0A6A5FNY7_PERFL|nr:hypothetical protein PFLUV_G00022940 [Perca fluviatilis]
MESTRAHGITRLEPRNGSVKITGKPDMRSVRHPGHLHLMRTVIFLIALTIQSKAVCAVGMFELQIHYFQNPLGLLQTGDCCDLQANGGQRCSARDQCDTFFQACLKEYQARVIPTGACTFGSGSTGILGGNSQTLHHRGYDGGGRGGVEDGTNGHIVIPFKYAWPKSFSLVLEALDYDNDTSESGQLIERVLLSSMLNPGEQWQTYRHHGRSLSLHYRLRFRCDSNYYGPFCNKFCRARDDFFGHFNCDPSGSKVCMEGWTGPECKEAVCRQGCHQVHGFCTAPAECKCHYGWKGTLCDQCVTFPGCVYGSCTEPWQCVCDVNWGGLLCDKVEHACLSSPCMNGATCLEDPTGFSCTCTDGWTGHMCTDAVRRCDRSPCGRGATCQETPGGYRCLCPPGWTGRTCQLDTNECEMSICVHARSCRNLIGGYLCDCLPGWTGPNCDIRNSSCQGLCLNGGRCEDQLSGSRCLCPPGFSGKYCQNGPSPCDSAPCLHGGQCVEKDGRTVNCNCPTGYSGVFCEIALDLCNPNPCQQGVPCRSMEGRYMCTCPEGYYGNKCISIKNQHCIGQHCQDAMSDTTNGGVSFYIILVSVLALVTVCGCAACAFILSHLHRKRKKQQAIPQEEGINNQREFVNLIRNVDRPVPLLPSATPIAHPPAPPAPVSRCYEEIELTLPPSPAPSHPSPAPKPAHGPKLDISNREREKLNRFHYTDNQELEA